MISEPSQASATRPDSIHSLPELLAPAGNWECAKAAVENGADAIYFGLDRFNARMRAQNFTTADLPELMAFLHQRGVKGYVTLNTLVFTNELTEAEQYLREIIAAGVDAVIVQDVGICRLIRHLSPDFPIHASTQMTVTSAAGVEFVRSLGCQLVVLARECSLKEINKIQQQLSDRDTALPLEVFVHGALCVAYSGQCLTSEALGGRSANRGECAQACRMTYDLIADGETVDLGDRQYLLSPQDLAGLDVLPELVQAGVVSLKIEGRLKAPEYVANVTRIYRQALDRLRSQPHQVSDQQRYDLEMAFSRGLHTGWFQGIDNQTLVHARFGKKRGVYVGEVTRIHKEQITVRVQAPIKAGDGVVFDQGRPAEKEEGGRVYSVVLKDDEAVLQFGRRDLDLRRIHVGDRLWKTSDPELDRQLRQSYAGDTPQFQRPISIEVHGDIGHPLTLIARDEQGHIIQLDSTMPLVEAHTKPLTTERLQEQLSRLGNTPFRLERLTNHLTAAAMLPISELNRLRRDMVERLEQARIQPHRWQLQPSATWTDLLPTNPPVQTRLIASVPLPTPHSLLPAPHSLIVLVRNLSQLDAALKSDIQTLYCEFEDPRAYREAVNLVRQQGQGQSIWVAPPRITKPGENWILQQVQSCNADGYLIRNYDHLQFFKDNRCIGDFSLNVANPLTAVHFKQFGLERLTASYDLNITQLEALLSHCSPDWFEVTVHQHMPMFHMEHCVFCAFLSTGTDFTNCGRPCENHEVTLRDRTGVEHVLHADAGCRNTVFNGTAQTGAEYVQRLQNLGLRQFRIEFVNESPEQVKRTVQRYQQLLKGEITGSQLWRELKLQHQLGVTRGR
ncbi:U32 family peptidase [Oscillatoria sp. FACHB-1407]|nr:U32 family peptidase [Oscillatoria sp. FACHB-1407]